MRMVIQPQGKFATPVFEYSKTSKVVVRVQSEKSQYLRQSSG